MARSSRPSAASAWKRALSAIGASTLVASAVLGAGSSAAVAAVTTFNPFDINNGFTTVARGDIRLGNAELEGSVAAFGSISTANQNGYPVLHQAAGEPDYIVPSIDGTPVRILADRFIGTGSFDVSNRDDSGTIDPEGPEANAVVKLAQIDGLRGSDRSGFLRLTNTDGGNLDLKTVEFAGADVADYRTSAPSVAAYFPDIDAHVAQANRCLAAMYDPDLGLTQDVQLEDQGGMVFPSGFATDRPNVIDYADIAGKTVKLDRAGEYAPSADAPLVIRVTEGTTDIGQLNFEGWSPQKGAQQVYARYIMLDMSEVTGDVTVNGFTLGAIWAPNASLHFDSGVTTNGQWFAGDITSAGGGEIHHHTFLGNLPCAEPSTSPTEPSIGTTVAVVGSDDKVLPLAGGTVIDTVTYAGLTPGETYRLSGELRTSPAGESTGITASAEFTPETASGTATVTFEINAQQAAAYAGQALVVFEYLTLNGEPVAEHTDPEDGAQTFTVEAAPTEPTEPTEPGDPTDPTDPTEPGDPGDPTDPSDPTEPGDPGDPSDPTDPGDPSDPTEPGDPTEPADPADPTDPSQPGEPQPGEPSDPSEPGSSEEAGDDARPAGAEDVLALTGAALAWPIAAGGALLLIGGAALLLIRRSANA